LLGAIDLVWLSMGRKWVPIVLCALAALAFPMNTLRGVGEALRVVAVESSMHSELRQGAPEREVVEKSFPNTRNQGHEESAMAAIPQLREAQIGAFAQNPTGYGLWWVALEVVVAALAGRGLWNLGRAVQAERARELFRLQHERYEEMLLHSAAATGLPRGLRWVGCSITGEAVLVRDAEHGGIVALVPVLVHFAPVEGSEMEQVHAAREPRPATAVFTFARGHWQTSGRVIFNHTPSQTVAKYAPQFRVIEHGRH
jgi:hypothetical protein